MHYGLPGELTLNVDHNILIKDVSFTYIHIYYILEYTYKSEITQYFTKLWFYMVKTFLRLNTY